MSSWGKPITSWTVSRGGESLYTFSRDVPGGGFRDYDRVTRRFTASAADFAKVEAFLKPAHPFAGGQIPCTLRITDGMYGKIGWSDGGEPRTVSFNFGCLSPTAETIYTGMMDARDHVKALSEAGGPAEIEEVRESRG